MTVTLTSPALDQAVGSTYTGPMEAWLVAEGYAHLNGDASDHLNQRAVMPADDPMLAVNREHPGEFDVSDPDPNLRWHLRGDMEAPEAGYTLSPATGPAAGGTVVQITGEGFLGVTGVTFGGNAGTALDVEDDEHITVTTPAHAAGAVTVAITDPDGTTSKPTGYTYT